MSHHDIMKPDEVGQAIVPVLACVLNQLCARNDRVGQVGHKHITKFHALRPPQISIRDYLQRILKYAACSGECFVLALVYIDRIIQSNPSFMVNSLNIHRLLITSVMLAAKFFDDQYFNNAYYAKVGGVPCGEVNSLEVEFLFMTNFTLFVNTDTYTQYYTELCNHANNPHNTCSCSQQKVPTLIIPYLDADGMIGAQGQGLLVPMPEFDKPHTMPSLEQLDLVNINIPAGLQPPQHITHPHHSQQQQQQQQQQQLLLQQQQLQQQQQQQQQYLQQQQQLQMAQRSVQQQQPFDYAASSSSSSSSSSRPASANRQQQAPYPAYPSSSSSSSQQQQQQAHPFANYHSLPIPFTTSLPLSIHTRDDCSNIGGNPIHRKRHAACCSSSSDLILSSSLAAISSPLASPLLNVHAI